MLVQDQNYLGFEAVRQCWWLLCWTHFPLLKASMITQIQICSYAGWSFLFNACCLLLFYHGLWPELPPQYLSMGSFHSFGKKSFKFSYLLSLLFPFISIKLVFNCKHSPQDSSHTLYWHEITTTGKLAIYQPAKKGISTQADTIPHEIQHVFQLPQLFLRWVHNRKDLWPSKSIWVWVCSVNNHGHTIWSLAWNTLLSINNRDAAVISNFGFKISVNVS